ncbi:MAG: GNAT family N-acetyltransferase [Candidatus Aminicenantales bacterium]
MIETKKFSETPAGTLSELLIDSYAAFPEFVEANVEDWQAFDAFVYSHLSFMDQCGFCSTENNSIIGFFSWDPRNRPASIEIGHNGIIREYQGRGKGKEQLFLALAMMSALKPRKIIVKTGNSPFFLPARRMYESAGFTKNKMEKRDDPLVPEIIEYELTFP